jgi:hypothetical protein
MMRVAAFLFFCKTYPTKQLKIQKLEKNPFRKIKNLKDCTFAFPAKINVSLLLFFFSGFYEKVKCSGDGCPFF